MHDALLVIGAFGASAVEMVEAATIVLAVGITYSWRTSLSAGFVALVALAILIAILGPSLTTLIPLNILQIVVGSLLFAFGLQWLRKAIQRSAHLRSQRDEAEIFQRELNDLKSMRAEPGSSATTGFLISFKGVFLEGLEVAFIVITFGGASGHTDLAAYGALAAAVVITLTALIVHRPLAKVPENTIKLSVGVMLVSFGTFWGCEGLGIDWFAGDATLLILIAGYAAVVLGAGAALRRGWLTPVQRAPGEPPAQIVSIWRWPVGVFRFWYDFLVGDSATLPIGTTIGFILCWVFATSGVPSVGEAAMPATALATLGVSVLWG